MATLLDTFYYDVEARDKATATIDAIEKKLNNLTGKTNKLKIDVDKTYLTNSLNNAIKNLSVSGTVKVKAKIDGAKINYSAIQNELNRHPFKIKIDQAQMSGIGNTLGQQIGSAVAKALQNVNIPIGNGGGGGRNWFAGGFLDKLGDVRRIINDIGALYTAGGFLKNIIEVGGQFETQRIALEGILQSATKAHAIFSQIQQLAVTSPYTFQDLASYAKQLSAYGIKYRELYDTTNRLADISAGLGVDMSRIILAYGQIRSATVLKGSELRQLTEAGIPMVTALADRFTQLEGKMVSAGDVFDRISKKMVSFGDVQAVLWDMTNEGGMFHNMQLRLASSTSGMVSNLTDSIQNIFYEINQEQGGFIKGAIGGLTELANHWRAIQSAVIGVSVAMAGINIKSVLSTLLQTKRFSNLYNDYTKDPASLMGKGYSVTQRAMISFFGGLAEKANLTADRINRVGGAFSGLRATGMRALGGLMKGFGNIMTFILNPTNVAIAAIGALIARFEFLREQANASKEFMRNEQIDSKDAETKLGKVVATYGVDKVDVNNKQELRTAIERMREELEETGVDFSLQMTLNADEALGTSKDVLSYLQQQLEAIKEARGLMSKTDNPLAVANGNTSSWLNDDFATNAKEAGAALQEAKNHLMTLSPKEFEGLDESLKHYVDQAKEAGFSGGEEYSVAFRQAVADNNYQTPDWLKDFFGDWTNFSADNMMDNINMFKDQLTFVVEDVKNSFANMGLNDETDADFSKRQALLQQWTNDFVNQYGIMEREADVLKIKLEESIIGSANMAEHGENMMRVFHEAFMKQLAADNKKLADATEDDIIKCKNSLKKRFPEIESIVDNFFANLQAKFSTPLDIIINVITKYQEIKDATDKADKERQEEERRRRAQEEAEKARLKAQRAADAQRRREESAARAREAKARQAEQDFNRSITDRQSSLNSFLQTYRKAMASGHSEWEAIDIVKKAGFSFSEGIGDNVKFGKDFDKFYRQEIEKLLEELMTKADRNGKLSPERQKIADSLRQTLYTLQWDEDKRRMKSISNEITKSLNEEAAAWKNYLNIIEKTGDARLAAALAYKGEYKSEQYLGMRRSEQIKKQAYMERPYAGEYDEKKLPYWFEHIEEFFKMNDEELEKKGLMSLKSYITEYDKAKKDEAQEDIKYILDLLTDGVDKLKSDFAQIEYVRNNTIRAINGSDLSKDEKDRLIAKANARADWQTFQASEDLSKLIDNPMARAKESFEILASVVRKNVEKAFEGGAITAKEYAENINKISEAQAKNTYGNSFIGKLNMSKRDRLINQRDLVTQALEEAQKNGDEDLVAQKTKELDDLNAAIAGLDVTQMAVEGVNNLIQSIKAIADNIREVQESLGVDTRGSDVYATIDALSAASQSLAEGVKSGTPLGMISGVVGMFTKPFTIFAKNHDEKLQKQIEKLERSNKLLGQMNTEIRNNRQRTLGHATDYNLERDNIREQLLNTQKMRKAEEDKKDSDKNAIDDYKANEAEQLNQILQYSFDLASELYGIDLKGWASQFGDALVSAWEKGESAANAFAETSKNILKDLASSWIKETIIQPTLQGLQTYLFGTKEGNFMDGAFSEDNELSPDEMKVVVKYLHDVDEGIADGNKLLDELDAVYYAEYGKHLNEENMQSLGNQISQITESTADLLAAYLNEVRQDVHGIFQTNSPILNSQLTELQNIANYTERNAVAAENIEAMLTDAINGTRKINVA